MRFHPMAVLAFALILVLPAMLSPVRTRAQENTLPGARGSLYESPSFGWILLLPEPDWRVVSATSAEGVDSVHLVSETGGGGDQRFVSFADDGRGSVGCVGSLLADLAMEHGGAPIRGLDEPGFQIFPPRLDDVHHQANVRVVHPDNPDLDILAIVSCTRSPSGILIGDTYQETALALMQGNQAPAVTPLLAGEGHTGRPRTGPGAGLPEQGVVRFHHIGQPAASAAMLPFNCLEQEAFDRPTDPLPPGTGYFACAGQILNVDVVPATIDLEAVALGCDSVPESDVPPAGCPAAPVAPSHIEILEAPAAVSDTVLTLQPGESATVVLWYTLPAGDPPLDILYIEPDRRVLVGPTFHGQGTGGRPPVRSGR